MSDAKEQVQDTSNGEVVIVLHGLARSRFAMIEMQWALEKAGYQAVNRSYPSRRHNIETLSATAINSALKECKNASRIHFVTHSMGGILVRQYLKHHSIENLGHVVMLGPPNKGSELVDFSQKYKLTKTIFNLGNGPAGLQLGTQAIDMPNQLGSVNFSLGVVAGNVSFSPLFSKLIEGDDDGKVSVESSKVDGMNDHIILPTSHTFMMRNKNVISQVLHYLEHGVFGH